MKIVCTITNDITFDQRMHRICNSLAEAGHHVVLVGRKLELSRSLAERKYKQVRLSCRFNKGKLFYIEYNLRLRKWLLNNDWDCVNAVDLDTLWAGTSAAQKLNRPLYFDAHEYFSETPEVVRRPLVQKFWSKLADSLVPKADHCYTVCHSLADVFSKKFDTPFSVIRNVPIKREMSFHKKENHILLYQGALNESRGIEQMIEAMPYIKDAQLWLVGEGDLSAPLRAQAAESSARERIHFKGRLEPEELHAITCECTIGLNLLEPRGKSYYYSLANKFFDYVQALVPSVNMDFPEYRKHIKEYEVGILIENLKPETIAEGINKLVDDKDLYNEMVDQCKLAQAEWNWSIEAQKLLEIYDGH